MPPPRLQCLHPHPLTLFLPLRPAQPPHPHPRTTLPLLHTRPASHASQGRANKAAPGPGKRLGAKKAASELVVPGNIIFRQRGTHWFPGENCGMGRDHTIFALEKGYVTYYRDPSRHKERKYIGIVFERGMKLPQAPGAARRRRLGLVGRERRVEAGEKEGRVDGGGLTGGGGEGKESVVKQVGGKKRVRVLDASQMRLREGYQYRESNWSIGRAAERMGVKIRAYKRGDRFLAWRKLNERKARNAERKALSSRKKKGGAK